MKKLKRHTAGRIALAWMPPVLGFAAGTGLVLRSHHVMVKTNMGLAAALKTAEASLEEYRKRGKNQEAREALEIAYRSLHTGLTVHNKAYDQSMVRQPSLKQQGFAD